MESDNIELMLLKKHKKDLSRISQLKHENKTLKKDNEMLIRQIQKLYRLKKLKFSKIYTKSTELPLSSSYQSINSLNNL